MDPEQLRQGRQHLDDCYLITPQANRQGLVESTGSQLSLPSLERYNGAQTGVFGVSLGKAGLTYVSRVAAECDLKCEVQSHA